MHLLIAKKKRGQKTFIATDMLLSSIGNHYINRKGNQERTIQRNWQHWAHKTQDEDKPNKKYNTICVGHHYRQANAYNVNKT